MFGVAKRAAVFAGLALYATLTAAASAEEDALCRACFGAAARAAPLPLAATNVALREVSLDGRAAGWLFRTDQVPPACKGKRGEIVLAVAVGADARIKGVRVVSHREDPPYFKRLTPSFFDQFVDRPAAARAAGVDAVTRATYSSQAVIREVLEGASHVVAQPEVAAKIAAASQSRLTKMAAMSHNQGLKNEGPL